MWICEYKNIESSNCQIFNHLCQDPSERSNHCTIAMKQNKTYKKSNILDIMLEISHNLSTAIFKIEYECNMDQWYLSPINISISAISRMTGISINKQD